jgi:uncharacterized cupin superfamily protein
MNESSNFKFPLNGLLTSPRYGRVIKEEWSPMSWQFVTVAAAVATGLYKGYAPDHVEPDPFIAAGANAMVMEPRPINPAWILSGEPAARVAFHSEPGDKCASTVIWDCTAGQFRWFFGWDEMVVILEGEVHVTAEDGSARTLTVGDVAYFRAGTWATWRIDRYVKKVAVTRRPFPLALSLFYRALGRLRSVARQGF